MVGQDPSQERLEIALGRNDCRVKAGNDSSGDGNPVSATPGETKQTPDEFIDGGQAQMKGLVDEPSKLRFVETRT